MKAKSDHGELSEKLVTFGLFLVFASPFILPAITSDKVNVFLEKNRSYIVLGSALIIIIRAFWHSFLRWDELDKRLKPKLIPSCGHDIEGCVDDGLGGTHGKNRVYRLRLDSDCDVDVTECKGLLTNIRKSSNPLFYGKEVPFTFQPAHDPDTHCKTIKRGRKALLDVIFLEFKDKQAVNVLPATIKHEWIYKPEFKDIFLERGEYILTLVIEANTMAALTCELKFVYDDDKSTMQLLSYFNNQFMPPSSPTPDK